MSHRLPLEILRIIIRYATSSDHPLSLSHEYALAEPDSPIAAPCLKYDNPLTPVIYHHQQDASPHATKEAFTQIRPKRAISLVCWEFNQIITEFLYETLYVSNARNAHQIANALESPPCSRESPGRWTRHLTIVGVFFAPSSSSTDFASAVLRILAHTPNLSSFHLSWNSFSRTLRQHEESIIRAVPTNSLRHFEWNSTGGGFESQLQHAFYRLLLQARLTLRVLKISGYLPLTEEQTPLLETAETRFSLPALTHLKVRRAFRDDLMLFSSWDISARLTCLSLGSIWKHLDNREVENEFWSTSKPALRCLHLGEGTVLCVQLAHKILDCSPALKSLEYYYLGNWNAHTWETVLHESLETVMVHTCHPTIAIKSTFNSRRYSREEQWEKLLRHIRPFVGSVEDVDSGPSGEYPTMKKVVLVEYSRKLSDLRYEPAELAEWLGSKISKFKIKQGIEFSVEVDDYIR